MTREELKQFEKSDEELIRDVIDMKLLDANTPLDIIKRGWSKDEENKVIKELQE